MLFLSNATVLQVIVQSCLKIKYSMRAKQLACQNMIVAVLFISFILLIVPLTIFEKPLLGLDKNSHLLLGCLFSLRHHSSLLEVTEVAFNWSSVIGVWPRVYHWHLQALDLILDVLFKVVFCVVHENDSVFAP